MNKKAQKAMEFLMTYGWAILVVVIALAMLIYFVKPSDMIPESTNCEENFGLCLLKGQEFFGVNCNGWMSNPPQNTSEYQSCKSIVAQCKLRCPFE